MRRAGGAALKVSGAGGPRRLGALVPRGLSAAAGESRPAGAGALGPLVLRRQGALVLELEVRLIAVRQAGSSAGPRFCGDASPAVPGFCGSIVPRFVGSAVVVGLWFRVPDGAMGLEFVGALGRWVGVKGNRRRCDRSPGRRSRGGYGRDGLGHQPRRGPAGSAVRCTCDYSTSESSATISDLAYPVELLRQFGVGRMIPRYSRFAVMTVNCARGSGYEAGCIGWSIRFFPKSASRPRPGSNWAI